MWLTAAFTLASAAFFVSADPLIGNGTRAFAQFAPLAAVMGGAQVTLLLSERLHASSWFWRLTPSVRRTPGLWWWVGGSALAAGISLPALVIPGIDGQLRSPMGAVVLAASCFGAAAIGRLSPWDSRSQGQQTAVTVLYFAALFAAAACFDWVTHRTSAALGLALVVTVCAALSAAVCVRVPWRTSWRAT